MRRMWAMERTALEQYWSAVTQQTITEQAMEAANGRVVPGTTVEDGDAVIPVRGILQEQYSAIADFLGYEQTAPSWIAKAIHAADSNGEVVRIVLDIDSPGGDVTGIPEVVERVMNARTPIYARIRGTGASAAYWIASQADEITVSPESDVGSIGVYTVVYDESEAAEREGVKVHVIGSGADKGAGIPGTALTASQAAALKENVDAIASIFVGDVAYGRGVARETVEGWASGRTWIGAQAKALGLVDAVAGQVARARRPPRDAYTITRNESIEWTTNDTEAELLMAPRNTGGQEMPTTNEGQAPAEGRDDMQRWQDLKAAFPLEFAAAQFETGADVDEAKAAYAGVLAEELEAKAAEVAERDERIQALETEVAELKSKLEAKQQQPEKGGVKPLENSARDIQGNGGGGFWGLVEARVAEGMPRHKALIEVARAEPKLHRAWKQTQKPA